MNEQKTLRNVLCVAAVLLFFAGPVAAQGTLQITTTTLPDAAVGVPYITQLAVTGGTAPYSWAITTGALPTTLVFTSSGAISGTPTDTGSFTFIVRVTDSSGTPQTANQVLTLRIGAPISITTTSFPNGIVGTAYPTQTLTATGGIPPLSWAVNAGSLPPGLVLSSNGSVVGTPSSAGVFSFVLRVTDSSNPVRAATEAFSITITASLAISTASLPGGFVDTVYTAQTLTVTGGTAPYLWSVFTGTPPPGLTLGTDGVFAGTPAVAGSFIFTVIVNDASGQTATKQFTMTITPKLVISSSSPLPGAIVGAFYAQQLTATGPTTAITWSVFSGNLPPGLSLASTGNISGTPTLAGTFEPTIQASSDSQTARRSFQIVVQSALTITTPATLPDAPLAAPYSVALAATGGAPPYTWTVTSGRLPAGLALSSSGVISGTPTGIGTFQIGVQLEDSSSPPLQATRAFSITVAAALTVTTTKLPNAFKDLAYSTQFTGTGGSTPFTWLVAAGTLPAGLTLTTGGLLSGTPTAVESQNITVTLTDGRGVVVSKDFTVVVDPQLTAFSTPSLPATVNPTQQLPLSVVLAEPHPSALAGRLTMTFTSKAEIPTNDPMTQFSNGTRTVNFTIAAGSKTAEFTSPVMVLVGTVAGTVKITANITDGPSDLAVTTMDVLALAPQITVSQAIRTANGLDLLLTGYASTRRVTSMEFDFEVKTGSKTQHVTLSKNVDTLFSSWYGTAASVAYGSSFSFTQTFILQASGSTIQSVTVTLKNAQGNTTTAPIKAQ